MGDVIRGIAQDVYIFKECRDEVEPSLLVVHAARDVRRH
jgi:hypothetical protein